MILITGGAYQGKRRYAIEHYQNRNIYYVQELIKEAALTDMEVQTYLEQLLMREPDAVLTLDDVGCGIVPLEKADREYRELVGRTGCYLAERAQQVIRVSCGIGQVIKG